jgi:hypothetical protein
MAPESQVGQKEMKCISKFEKYFHMSKCYSGERCGPWASCFLFMNSFDGIDGNGAYKYYFGVCTKAMDRNDVDVSSTGLLQIKQDKKKTAYRLGKYTNATIISGSMYHMFVYMFLYAYH